MLINLKEIKSKNIKNFQITNNKQMDEQIRQDLSDSI